MIRIIITITIAAIISACSGMATYKRAEELANKDLRAEKSPYRAKHIDLGEETVLLSYEFAGIPGESIVKQAEPALETDIYRILKNKCDYLEANLIETRVVEHKHPEYYEVWVFNDEKSQVKDGISAISVHINFLPNGGGADLEFTGDCHS
ncbi:MAG: hypothetical protein V7731_23830 [Amphritea sp.]